MSFLNFELYRPPHIIQPKKVAEEEETELVSLGLRKPRDYSVKIKRTDSGRLLVVPSAA